MSICVARASRPFAFRASALYISPSMSSSDTKHPGLASRQIAAQALFSILYRGQPLDRLFEGNTLEGLSDLDERDRALVRMLVTKALRRLGTLRALVTALLEKPLPSDARYAEVLLLLGATQILFLDVKDHAAVDLSVELANRNKPSRRYAGLVNAVLRRIAREGKERIQSFDITIDTPQWRLDRWIENYGEAKTREIVTAHQNEPALDITVKENPQAWSEKLGGLVLPTGSIRIANAGLVTELEGYEEGAWWVQDTAASLPAKLLGDVIGRRVADLCAAPGGKTAQLIAAGANVVAVDRSAPRLHRLAENLERLKLSCEIVEADAAIWQTEPFDAILLDAPCTATGTIRRNPDLPWQQRPEDLARLSALQAKLLDNAAKLLKPGGILVYATCSLEPEECGQQIENFLASNREMKRTPITGVEVGGIEPLISECGDLRTLPCHLPNQEPRLSGCDGFYAARLQRLG
jgi:16S rRNA (cytosine967-C5)-methyltransferase